MLIFKQLIINISINYQLYVLPFQTVPQTKTLTSVLLYGSVQAAWWKSSRHSLAGSEDVGNDFGMAEVTEEQVLSTNTTSCSQNIK